MRKGAQTPVITARTMQSHDLPALVDLRSAQQVRQATRDPRLLTLPSPQEAEAELVANALLSVLALAWKQQGTTGELIWGTHPLAQR